MDKQALKERLQSAKLRRLAKAFRDSIPAQMAIRLPDEVVNQIPEGAEAEFVSILKTLRLQQQPSGHWEREW